jgi:hypothetical protein
MSKGKRSPDPSWSETKDYSFVNRYFIDKLDESAIKIRKNRKIMQEGRDAVLNCKIQGLISSPFDAKLFQ